MLKMHRRNKLLREKQINQNKSVANGNLDKTECFIGNHVLPSTSLLFLLF